MYYAVEYFRKNLYQPHRGIQLDTTFGGEYLNTG